MSSGREDKTRTRAIASTLTARLSPTFPSPSQTYEPLVRSVLRQRLTHNIFAFSIAFTLVVNVIFGGENDTSTFVRLIQPQTWAMGCFKWAVGVLPVVALRKVYLTGKLLHLISLLCLYLFKSHSHTCYFTSKNTCECLCKAKYTSMHGRLHLMCNYAYCA